MSSARVTSRLRKRAKPENASGSEHDTDSSTNHSQHQQLMIQRRREQNRNAAATSRNKRKAKLTDALFKVNFLEGQLNVANLQIRRLTAQVDSLTARLQRQSSINSSATLFSVGGSDSSPTSSQLESPIKIEQDDDRDFLNAHNNRY